MHLSFARRGKITDSLLSKAVLSSIANGNEPPADIVAHLGIGDIIPELKELFIMNRKEADERPRYLPFYRAIQDRFPSFTWQLSQREAIVHSVLEKPFIGNKRPTLLTLLMCCISGDIRPGCALKADHVSARELPDSFTVDFSRFLHENNFYQLSEPYFRPVAQSLLRGFNGEKITLISPVCPDYAYRRHNDHFRYTFDGVGDGIGLVASRILEAAPKLKDLLERHGAEVEVVLAAGDFEGFDEATLHRVNETRATFRSKLEVSMEKLTLALDCGARKIFVSEHAGGEEEWYRLTSRALAALERELLLDANLTAQLQEAQIARRSLYHAWHPGRSDATLKQVLGSQAAEYAAMGELFTSSFNNPLVLGCDHCRMLPFYSLLAEQPAVYINRAY